jgi:hypothetical protein
MHWLLLVFAVRPTLFLLKSHGFNFSSLSRPRISFAPTGIFLSAVFSF